MSCPLCRAARLTAEPDVQGRRYHGCQRCGLIHMDPSHRPDPGAEKAHYDLHENNPADPRYRDFLERLASPLSARLDPGAVGLDYGSGPGPTLSVMLEERGFQVAVYDPFYAPDSRVLRQEFDFITCTETIEHFFDPRGEFQQFDHMLHGGGWLGLMTEWVPADRDLPEWRYARDPTHVCFYRPRTFEWIGRRFGWTIELMDRNVTLFRKRQGGAGRGASGSRGK